MKYLNRSLTSTGFFTAGLILLFIAENMLYSTSMETSTLSPGYFIGLVLALILLAVSFGLRILRLQLPGSRKSVDLSILLAQVVIALGVLFYFLESREVIADMFREANDPEAAQDWQDMFKLIAFLFTLGGMLFLTFKEISFFRMDHLEDPDKVRIQSAGWSSLIVTLTIANVILVWYILSFQNWDIELIETAGRSEPTIETLAMTEVIPEDIQITVKLFYPYGSDTRAFLQNYFDAFTHKTEQVTVEVIDAELEPDLADEYGLENNGYVIIDNGTDHKKERIDAKMTNALSQLQGFDSKVFKHLNALVTPERTVYFTKGHGELSRLDRDTTLSLRGRSIKIPALGLLKSYLDLKNFHTQELDYAKGLGHEIPDDCDILVIAAPDMPFSDSAIAAVKEYLEDGGRLLLLLDPEQNGDVTPLLDYLNLEYSPNMLYNDDPGATLDGKANYMPAIGFSNHETVRLLRTKQYAYLAALKTGALDKKEESIPGMRVDLLMKSPDETWADIPMDNHDANQKATEKTDTTEHGNTADLADNQEDNDLIQQLSTQNKSKGNGLFDENVEVKTTHYLAAAVSKLIQLPAPPSSDDSDETEEAEDAPKNKEMRVVVTAGRYLVAIPGMNEIFVDGIFNWLNPEPAIAAKAMPAPPQKESAVFETTQGQIVMFWASIIFLPILILVLGIAIYIARNVRGNMYMQHDET